MQPQSYAIECHKCADYLGFGAVNPAHDLPFPCLSQLEQWCMYTRSPKCADCMELNLQEYIPNACYGGLQRLFQDECEIQSSFASTIGPNSQGEDEAKTGGIGSVPIVLFIGLLVILMIMICRKLLEHQDTESGIDENGLISEASDIRLESGHGGYEADFNASSYYSPYGSEGYSSGYVSHAPQQYPEGRNAMTERHSYSTEDPYRYHRQPQHLKKNSDQSLSSHHSYSFSKHSTPPKRSVSSSQHHPFAHNGSSESSLLDAQDSLRANGKEGIRRIGSGLAPLPPVHEDQFEPGSPLARNPRPDSTTTARQLRINTLLNQNTSTSSIYSGELLIPSNPIPAHVPRKESNQTHTSGNALPLNKSDSSRLKWDLSHDPQFVISRISPSA